MTVKSKQKNLTKHEREVELLRENKRVRFRKIFPVGWPEDDIETLVRSSISPHDAEELLEKGCPPELIMKILL